MKNEESIAQETFDLLALASKELPLARLKAKNVKTADLSLTIISEFLDHPNQALSTFAGELMLLHFPEKTRYSTLAKFMISPNRSMSYIATELAVKNFPEQLDPAVVRAYARKHRCLAVKDASRERLENVAEQNFLKYAERQRRL